MNITGIEHMRLNRKKIEYNTVSEQLQQELNIRLKEDCVQYDYLPIPQLYVSELQIYEIKPQKGILKSLAHGLKNVLNRLRRVHNKIN